MFFLPFYPFTDAIIKADVIRTVPLSTYSSTSSTSSSASTAGYSNVNRVGHGGLSAFGSQSVSVPLGSPPSSASALASASASAPSLPMPSPLASAIVPLSDPGALEKSNLPNDFYIGPYLDGNEMTNVTVQKGTNAYLPCKVRSSIYLAFLLLFAASRPFPLRRSIFHSDSSGNGPLVRVRNSESSLV